MIQMAIIQPTNRSIVRFPADSVDSGLRLISRLAAEVSRTQPAVGSRSPAVTGKVRELVRILNQAALAAENTARELRRLSGGSPQQGPQPGGTPRLAAGPAAALVVPLISLGLLVFLICLALLLLAFAYVMTHLDEIRQWLSTGAASMRTALQELIGLRTRTQTAQRTVAERGSPNQCNSEFDEVLRIINRMIERFQSRAATQRGNTVFYTGIRQLARELSQALGALLSCADPDDTLGLRRLLLGPEGVLRLAVEAVSKIVEIAELLSL